MIKVLKVTVQNAPIGDDPMVWVMDFVATFEDGYSKHGSWNSISMEGCLHGLPEIIDRLNNQETYA